MICFCLIQVFSSVFYFGFCFPCVLYFSLSKATSCSIYTHCHSSKLEVLSNLGSDNSLHYYGAYQLISLLNLPNSATTVLYCSSHALSFSSEQSCSTWYHKTMGFLSL